MATKHGKDGIIKVDGAAVGKMQSWELSEALEEVDNPSMGDTVVTSLAGMQRVSGSFSVAWDKADSGQNALSLGVEVSLVMYPEGDSASDVTQTVSGRINNIGRPQNLGQRVEYTYGWSGQSTVVESTV